MGTDPILERDRALGTRCSGTSRVVGAPDGTGFAGGGERHQPVRMAHRPRARSRDIRAGTDLWPPECTRQLRRRGDRCVRIEWNRMAEPQDDLHDSRVVWDLVTTTTSPVRRVPHRRRLPQGAPTLFDGAVAIRYIADVPPGAPQNANGPLQHPNMEQAVEYVRRWPAAYQQFRMLMDTFHPMIDTRIPPERWNVQLGSNSHSDEDKFGTMYATVFDPIGTAEAMVHEMAHNKLRGLGIYVEAAQRLITNAPDQLFESPIRKDRMRPMTAVLHAQYSFIHVTQLDLKMLAVETDTRVRDGILSMLAWNVPRMELGYDEIRSSIRVDAMGQMFIDGFFAWSDRVIEEGNQALREMGVAKRPLERTPGIAPPPVMAD
ncbi:MAG: HEXXH motif domain-containing protein [Proteobacteria bacterium]|nr:HEXXH motif domain-containing protein [Pseudomonadota bacterium]